MIPVITLILAQGLASMCTPTQIFLDGQCIDAVQFAPFQYEHGGVTCSPLDCHATYPAVDPRIATPPSIFDPYGTTTCCSILTYDTTPRQLGPYSSAINIEEDLGSPETSEPSTWGTQQAFASKIKFNAPEGYRVRIERVYGDFIGYPRKRIPQDTSVEIGWGLKTTAPDGSKRVTFPGYAASGFDNSFIWLQDYLGDLTPRSRMPFDHDVHIGGLLEPDNILISQAFVALNTTGVPIHLEATLVCIYSFVKVVD